MRIVKTYSDGLSKLLSSELIRGIYPMVDRIEAVFFIDERTDSESIYLYIYLNDKTINKDNMYIKDFDPHYLVDNHVRKLISFFDLPKNTKIFTTVLNPNGKSFFYIDY